MLRIVVDTNIVVSAAIQRHGHPFELLEALRNQAFQLVITSRQRAEIEDVLSRPKIIATYNVTRGYLDELLYIIDSTADVVENLEPNPVTVRDPKDEAILATALSGHADYLASGDADLLVLADDPAIRPLRIVTVRELLEVLAEP